MAPILAPRSWNSQPLPTVAPVLAVAAASWLLLAALNLPGTASHVDGHAAHAGVTALPVASELAALLHWPTMAAAMMLPLLIPSADYVAVRSFGHRRLRAQVSLMVGFVGTWSLAGVALVPLLWLGSTTATAASTLAIWLTVAACAWQLSRARSDRLRRCHATFSLRPSGLAADWDCLRYGVQEGISCCRTCLPAMMAMMLSPLWHWLAVPMAWLVVREHASRRPQGAWMALLLVVGATAAWLAPARVI